MRFTIEQRHLTDDTGKPIGRTAVQFHVFDADTLDDALDRFVVGNEAEVVGSVLKFPGLRAMATIRKSDGVFTLQFTPASHDMSPIV